MNRQDFATAISKHSAAIQITIDLQQCCDTVHLKITDNGQGFNPEKNTTGFGLQGMRERTATLSG